MQKTTLPTALLVVIGTIGGFLAALVHLPMPWLTGSLVLTTLTVRFVPASVPDGYKYPNDFRNIFIAVIGMVIGLQVHPELFRQIPTIAWSLAALTLFVPLIMALNYLLFTRVAGFDKPTAFFAGAPGGLVEAIAFGEESGADSRILALQQFLRITVVITLVPFGMSWYEGHPVGSAAGLSNQLPSSDLPLWATLAVLIPVGALGQWAGTRLRLPAGHLLGPLVAAAVLNFLPIPSLAMPVWALVAAQVVIGSALGSRFHELSGRQLARGVWLALASTAMMLGVGLAFAWVLNRMGGLPIDVLLVAYAPGGVTEMGLIAISLATSPALVIAHHVYRIIINVVIMNVVRRRWRW
ncbi:AbrB family transcriptional regulator [Mesobacterium pallidum]|uniref:AbrB family transcriptional regulator n=1 Tax=Mesobacterium pallidum TaxID=2872037 RepID=UPI001EE21A0A|nr:AbrB family transcriptional regulator [Mesobacterium pallidum]